MAEPRALVVDDELLFRTQFTDLLRSRGVAVDSVESGEEAVRKIEEQNCDIVFLDLVLPRMTGQEALDRMLALRPELNVIVVTAHGTIESAAEAMKRGALYYLTKPVEGATLDGVIRNCLERTRLFQQNKILSQEVLLDTLTLAYNRRFLDRYLEEEMARSRRYGHPFSLIFVDVDHLKALNDRYGHLAGSQALRDLAHTIGQRLRHSDKIARYGGDEFIVCLPETDAAGALRTAHRLRQAVQERPFVLEAGGTVQLSASFGVATFPQDGETAEELMHHADAALYQVKTSSRGEIAVWSGS